MATPEIRAQEGEQLSNPELTLAVVAGAVAVEQTVEFEADYSAMSPEEYKAFIHWTALSGDAKGASAEDLLGIKHALDVRQREIARQTAELTVRVSNLQLELASASDKQGLLDEMVADSERLLELHHELLLVQDKKGWVLGYITDRLPR